MVKSFPEAGEDDPGVVLFDCKVVKVVSMLIVFPFCNMNLDFLLPGE